MKLRLAIIGLAMAVVILVIVLVTLGSGRAERELEATRRELRQQGFKTELDQFNFSTSPELRNRSVPLTGNVLARRFAYHEPLDFMAPVGSNTALLLWPLEKLPSVSKEDGWPALRESLEQSRAALDAASEAALSGPIQFDLDAGAGNAMSLRHLAGLRNFVQTFSARAVWEMHDGNKDAAWTNLLTATRLATAWEPEPVEISHFLRFTCADTAFKATWQLLASRGWDDVRLAALQQEWEGADFFKHLAETAAFSRASLADSYRREREQPPPSGWSFKQLLANPRDALPYLRSAWQQWRYRHQGIYEDEKNLLLYYRDRESQLSRASQSANWLAMGAITGITNPAPFPSKYPSRAQVLINARQLTAALQNPGHRIGLIDRAAETEILRRIVITAIALERFRAQHDAYPETLMELSPAFLKEPLLDFANGQPLHYRLADGGHFLLYSVGVDGEDDHGALPQPISARERFPNVPQWPLGLRRYNSAFMGTPGNGKGTDLVWALPAPAEEIKAVQDKEQREENERQAAASAAIEVEEKSAEDRRLATVQKYLSQWQALTNGLVTPLRHPQEPEYQGKPLSEFLRDGRTAGTNRPGLYELLTLKPIITGEEPTKATFQLPLKYDAVTNLGELNLILDGGTASSGDNDFDAGQTLVRATNGDCLLVWDTTAATPGQHVVQASFYLTREDNSFPARVAGPILPYFSSNLFQFVPRYNQYDPEIGLTLHAKLVETNGIYAIEIRSLSGEHFRTLSGRTTNGIINEHWNLVDDHGKRHTNDTLDISYDITLPDSGRRQVVK